MHRHGGGEGVMGINEQKAFATSVAIERVCLFCHSACHVLELVVLQAVPHFHATGIPLTSFRDLTDDD